MCAIPKPRKNVSKGVFQTVRAFLCHENINAHWSIITICIFIVIYRNSYVSMEGFWTVKGLFLDIRTIVTQSLKDSEMCTFKTVHYFLIRNYFSLSMKRSFKLRVTIWLQLPYCDVVIPSHPLNVVSSHHNLPCPELQFSLLDRLLPYTFQTKLVSLLQTA